MGSQLLSPALKDSCFWFLLYRLPAWLHWISTFWTRFRYIVQLLIFHPLFCRLNLTYPSKSDSTVAPALSFSGSPSPKGISLCIPVELYLCLILSTWQNWVFHGDFDLHGDQSPVLYIFVPPCWYPIQPSLLWWVYSKYFLCEWL